LLETFSEIKWGREVGREERIAESNYRRRPIVEKKGEGGKRQLKTL